MKLIFTALLGMFALGVSAQTDPARIKPAATNIMEVATPSVTDSSVSLKAVQSLEQKPPVPLKPNEIKTEKGVSSGVLPQLVKSDNPLQLINPAAPAEYGQAKDNTVFDDRTGQAQGIKLFSFSWFNKDKKKTAKVSAPKPEKKPKAESK